MIDRFWRTLLGRPATQAENTPAAPGMAAPGKPVGGIVKLTPEDRSDCCGAPSRVAVLLAIPVPQDIGEPEYYLTRLDFCAPHYAKHEKALASRVDAVRDERSPHERIAPRT